MQVTLGLIFQMLQSFSFNLKPVQKKSTCFCVCLFPFLALSLSFFFFFLFFVLKVTQIKIDKSYQKKSI